MMTPNGKNWIREVTPATYERVLDYTSVATPLNFESIIDDIQEVRRYHGETPAKIIMWEHQRDWLKKAFKRAWSSRYGLLQALPLDTTTPADAVMGIPVELAS